MGCEHSNFMDCCEQECRDRCARECCEENSGGNLIWIISLIVIGYCLLTSDNKNGGLLGGLF